jgi:hypothetical protein
MYCKVPEEPQSDSREGNTLVEALADTHKLAPARKYPFIWFDILIVPVNR